MPFDGGYPLLRPALSGRIEPALVDPRWRTLWNHAETVMYTAADSGDGQGVYDHVAGQIATRTGVAGKFGARVDDLFGPGVDFVGGGFGNNASLDFPGKATGMRDFTVAALVIMDATASFQAIFQSGSANNVGFRMQVATSTLTCSRGGIADDRTIASFPTGVPVFCAWTYRGSTPFTNVACFRRLDTMAFSSSSGTGSASFTTENGTQRVGNFGTGHTDSMWNGAIAFVFSSNCYIGAEGIRAWSKDPWGPFREIVADGIGIAATAGSDTILELGTRTAHYLGQTGNANLALSLGTVAAQYAPQEAATDTDLIAGTVTGDYVGQSANANLAMTLGTRGAEYSGQATAASTAMTLGTALGNYIGQAIEDLGGAFSLIMGTAQAVYQGAAMTANTTLALGTRAAQYVGQATATNTVLALGTAAASYIGQALTLAFAMILVMGTGTARYFGKAVSISGLDVLTGAARRTIAHVIRRRRAR